tara:strand:- start:211 stop:408 length:198 start_codon:yes stop_codon:yes gene_type:complete
LQLLKNFDTFNTMKDNKGLNISEETIKKVLDSTADKWNARYRKLNRQARRNRQARSFATWMSLGK